MLLFNNDTEFGRNPFPNGCRLSRSMLFWIKEMAKTEAKTFLSDFFHTLYNYRSASIGWCSHKSSERQRMMR